LDNTVPYTLPHEVNLGHGITIVAALPVSWVQLRRKTKNTALISRFFWPESAFNQQR
jgi:hypothetical protein